MSPAWEKKNICPFIRPGNVTLFLETIVGLQTAQYIFEIPGSQGRLRVLLCSCPLGDLCPSSICRSFPRRQCRRHITNTVVGLFLSFSFLYKCVAKVSWGSKFCSPVFYCKTNTAVESVLQKQWKTWHLLVRWDGWCCVLKSGSVGWETATKR